MAISDRLSSQQEWIEGGGEVTEGGLSEFHLYILYKTVSEVRNQRINATYNTKMCPLDHQQHTNCRHIEGVGNSPAKH